jgi:hypothetical protein
MTRLVLVAALLLSAGSAPAQTLDAGRVRFEHDQRTKGIAQHLAQRADRHAARLEERLQAPLSDQPITVLLAPTDEELQSKGPTRVPKWAAGVAWPKLNTIVLRTHSGTTDLAALERRLVHELAHVVVQRAAGQARVPTWLTEGVAQSESGQGLFERNRALVPASITGELMSIRELTYGFPPDHAGARLAYAQSLALVHWIEREYGPEAIPPLLAQLRQGEDLDRSLVVAVGRNLASLEHAYKDRVTWVHAWVPLIGSSGTLWVLTTLLFVAAWARKRRERNEKLARMRAEEEAWKDAEELRKITRDGSLWRGAAFRDPSTDEIVGPDGQPWSEP